VSDPAVPQISDFLVRICKLCGDYGDHDCPGPRIDRQAAEETPGD